MQRLVKSIDNDVIALVVSEVAKPSSAARCRGDGIVDAVTDRCRSAVNLDRIVGDDAGAF